MKILDLLRRKVFKNSSRRKRIPNLVIELAVMVKREFQLPSQKLQPIAHLIVFVEKNDVQKELKTKDEKDESKIHVKDFLKSR
jgi:hypothetical protein